MVHFNPVHTRFTVLKRGDAMIFAHGARGVGFVGLWSREYIKEHQMKVCKSQVQCGGAMPAVSVNVGSSG